MLSKLLNENTVLVNPQVNDWEEAVRVGGKLLENEGLIKPSYIQAMIDNVYKIGDYIVIAPGIAMPHARPECGAIGVGLALLKLENKIKFGKNKDKDVDIMFFLCSPDNTSHIKVISELMAILDDEEFIAALRAGMSKEEIIEYINNKF